MTVSRSRAGSRLEIEIIDRTEAAEAIADAWADLADRTASGPFSTPDFALAWWRHLGKGELLLGVARNGRGDLVGLAPLHERRRGGVSIVRWLGHGLGAVGMVLVDDTKADVAGALWSALADPRRVLDLSNVRLDARGFDALRETSSWHIHATLCDRCPTVEISPEGGAAALLATPDRSGLRKKLAKTDRTLAAGGHEFRVEQVADAAELGRALPAIEQVYDAAEQAHPRLHLLSAGWREFFVDALTRCAERGALTVLIGHLDDRPVVFDVYVRTGAVAHAWLGRYDPIARDVSPGHLLLRAGVDWAAMAGVHTVDLQLGTDQYKRRWADGGYDTVRVVAATDGGRLRAGRAGVSGVDTGYDLLQRLRTRTGRFTARS